MTETEATDETWWTRWKVPAAPVMLAIAMMAGALAFAFLQQSWDREAAEQRSCVVQQEFRTFFVAYLEDQVGVPVEEIPGFDQLSPEARDIVLSFAPVLEADRLADTEALDEYLAFVADHPLPCP